MRIPISGRRSPVYTICRLDHDPIMSGRQDVEASYKDGMHALTSTFDVSEERRSGQLSAECTRLKEVETNTSEPGITLRTSTAEGSVCACPYNEQNTYNPGTECSLVVRWCLLRSASLANCLSQPLILHGHAVESEGFFGEDLSWCWIFFLRVSFFCSGYAHEGNDVTIGFRK